MTDRPQLQPVPGLARSTKIVGPPRRKPAEPDVPVAAPEPTKRRASSPAKSVPPSASGFKRVTLSLPVAVAEALRDRAASDKAAQADVLMDALEATRDSLPALLEEGETHRRSGLFVRSAPRVNEPLTTLSLRVLASNVQVIDQLVTALRAPSRSRMCTVALREYLEHK